MEQTAGKDINIYTNEMVGYPGATHIAGDDYSEVIAKALAATLK